MNTNEIAKRVAAAHLNKTASSDRNFFTMVDKSGWRKIRQSLQKAGDQASVKMWDEASQKLAKALEMPSNFDVALTKMMNLVERGPRDAGMTRNQVFKIGDLLGIKLPHSIFGSDKTAATKGSGNIERGLNEAINNNTGWTGSKRMRIKARDWVNTLMVSLEKSSDDEARTAAKTKKLAEALAQYAKLVGGLATFDVEASDKTAKNHRVGLPPYGSWRDFVNFVQLREMQNSTTPQTAIDLKHAIRELQNYAAHDGESARNLKAAVAAVIDAQNIHHKQAQLARDFDTQMLAVHKALKKAGQL